MKCLNPQCGCTDHEPGAKYCHRCGTTLVKGDRNPYSDREQPKLQTHSNHEPSRNERNGATHIIGREAIDLGLPSGTKWANMNIGAKKPEDDGKWYSWGASSLGDENFRQESDLVRPEWGDKWTMPTHEQFQELIDYCTYKWTTLNGVKGGRFTGPNGNNIFMPAAGYIITKDIIEYEEEGHYWSYTKDPDNEVEAFCLFFDDSPFPPMIVSSEFRLYQTIRAVATQ